MRHISCRILRPWEHHTNIHQPSFTFVWSFLKACNWIGLSVSTQCGYGTQVDPHFFHVSLLQWTPIECLESCYWLVVWTPLKNMKVNWDDEIPNIWENKKCSKPPTSANMEKQCHCCKTPGRFQHVDLSPHGRQETSKLRRTSNLLCGIYEQFGCYFLTGIPNFIMNHMSWKKHWDSSGSADPILSIFTPNSLRSDHEKLRYIYIYMKYFIFFYQNIAEPPNSSVLPLWEIISCHDGFMIVPWYFKTSQSPYVSQCLVRALRWLWDVVSQNPPRWYPKIVGIAGCLFPKIQWCSNCLTWLEDVDPFKCIIFAAPHHPLRGKHGGPVLEACGIRGSCRFWSILTWKITKTDVPIACFFKGNSAGVSMDFRLKQRACHPSDPSDPSDYLSDLGQGSYPPDTDLPKTVLLRCFPSHVQPAPPRRQDLNY